MDIDQYLGFGVFDRHNVFEGALALLFRGSPAFSRGRLRAMWQASEEIAELIDSANATAEKPLTREEGAILGAKVEPSGRQSDPLP